MFESTDQNPVWHPREDDLLLYVDGELPSREAAHLRSHLNACWACRVKAEKVEAATSAFMEYRNRVSAELPMASTGSAFHNRLHELARQQRAGHRVGAMILEMRREGVVHAGQCKEKIHGCSNCC